jgi:hypothetical protein
MLSIHSSAVLLSVLESRCTLSSESIRLSAMVDCVDHQPCGRLVGASKVTRWRGVDMDCGYEFCLGESVTPVLPHAG